ncbi:hypothetical protein B9Z55_012970 [Caenorhabditis nigoni]|nr:hypothetical protein B9Z55_012970 [Caenorhabditis nigoni]
MYTVLTTAVTVGTLPESPTIDDFIGATSEIDYRWILFCMIIVVRLIGLTWPFICHDWDWLTRDDSYYKNHIFSSLVGNLYYLSILFGLSFFFDKTSKVHYALFFTISLIFSIHHLYHTWGISDIARIDILKIGYGYFIVLAILEVPAAYLWYYMEFQTARVIILGFFIWCLYDYCFASRFLIVDRRVEKFEFEEVKKMTIKMKKMRSIKLKPGLFGPKPPGLRLQYP